MSEVTLLPKKSLQTSPSVRRFLQPAQVQMIDEALCSLGEYGEVHLVIEKGRLRFMIIQKSFDTLKWYPGNIVNDSDG